MGSINYNGVPTKYMPGTILYSQQLNDDLNPLYNALKGIFQGIGVYDDTDETIEENTNVTNIAGIVKKCLDNLLQNKNGENVKSIIKINKINQSNNGIEIIYNGADDKTYSLVLKDTGVTITSGVNTLVVNNGDSNTTDSVTINGKNLIYSLDAEQGSNKKIKKLYYNESEQTIYFE